MVDRVKADEEIVDASALVVIDQRVSEAPNPTPSSQDWGPILPPLISVETNQTRGILLTRF